MLIVGVTRRAEPSLVALMQTFLTTASLDTERATALKVLCRYWGLWDQFLDYVMDNISPETFDAYPMVADQAFNLLGEYLSGHLNRKAWGRLVGIYEGARAASNEELTKAAYASIHVGLVGPKEALRQRLKKEFRENDSQVLAEARSKVGLVN